VEQSDEAWRAGHAAAVMPATVAFVVALIAAIVGIFVPAVYAVAVIVAVLGTIWVFVRATNAAKRDR